MQVIRERHTKSREEVKQLFIEMLQQNGFDSIVQWDGFAFAGKTKGTTVQGEIFEDEVHIEISGLLEKVATHQFRQSWKELVQHGRV